MRDMWNDPRARVTLETQMIIFAAWAILLIIMPAWWGRLIFGAILISGIPPAFMAAYYAGRIWVYDDLNKKRNEEIEERRKEVEDAFQRWLMPGENIYH